MIVFLTHKINPKVFCPNFGVHFIMAGSLIFALAALLLTFVNSL